jgi:hypothetical protein
MWHNMELISTLRPPSQLTNKFAIRKSKLSNTDSVGYNRFMNHRLPKIYNNVRNWINKHWLDK